MKKSTEQTQAVANANAKTESDLHPKEDFWTSVIFTEGGVSLLIIFPLTVLYFLVRALG